MIGATVAQLVFYATLDPIIFIIERLFEGLILGFFFPNLQASISDNAEIDHQKYLARFNLSWGIAGIFGLLFGTLVLQFIDDLRFLFYINPIFMAINVVIAIFFFQETMSDKRETQNIDIDEKRSSLVDHKKTLAIFYYLIEGMHNNCICLVQVLIKSNLFFDHNRNQYYEQRPQVVG